MCWSLYVMLLFIKLPLLWCEFWCLYVQCCCWYICCYHCVWILHMCWLLDVIFVMPVIIISSVILCMRSNLIKSPSIYTHVYIIKIIRSLITQSLLLEPRVVGKDFFKTENREMTLYWCLFQLHISHKAIKFIVNLCQSVVWWYTTSYLFFQWRWSHL